MSELERGYHADTEFLSNRGWLTYGAIRDSDSLAMVSRDGQVSFGSFGARWSAKHSGTMLLVQHRYTRFAVVGTHPVWGSPVLRGPSASIGAHYRPDVADWQLVSAASINKHWHVRVAGDPRTKEHPVTDAYLALIGCFVSEGCVARRLQDGSPSVLSFTQKDGGRLEQHLRIAGREFSMREYHYHRTYPDGRNPDIDYGIYTLADRSLASAIASECGEGARNKQLPAWALSLSTRQAGLLLKALLDGDGTFNKNGYWVYYTSSPMLAGDVQALALLSGRRANVWGPYAKHKGMCQVLIQDVGNPFQAIVARNNASLIEVSDQPVVGFDAGDSLLVTRTEGKVAFQP